MLLNRKLNETEIKLGELRLGNIICDRNQVSTFLIVGIDGFAKKVKLAKAKKDSIEYEDKLVGINSIKGVQLWDSEYENIHLKAILFDCGFILVDSKIYKKSHEAFDIFLIDDFYISNKAHLSVKLNGELIAQTFIWYFHEMQNFVFEFIREEIFISKSNKLLKNLNLL